MGLAEAEPAQVAEAGEQRGLFLLRPESDLRAAWSWAEGRGHGQPPVMVCHVPEVEGQLRADSARGAARPWEMTL